jgi:hypothetical protein
MVKKNYKLNDKQQRQIEKLMKVQGIDLDDIDYFIDSILSSRYNLILKSDKAAREEKEENGFDLKTLENFYV